MLHSSAGQIKLHCNNANTILILAQFITFKTIKYCLFHILTTTTYIISTALCINKHVTSSSLLTNKCFCTVTTKTLTLSK